LNCDEDELAVVVEGVAVVLFDAEVLVVVVVVVVECLGLLVPINEEDEEVDDELPVVPTSIVSF
jgi:hypothetical protein